MSPTEPLFSAWPWASTGGLRRRRPPAAALKAVTKTVAKAGVAVLRGGIRRVGWIFGGAAEEAEEPPPEPREKVKRARGGLFLSGSVGYSTTAPLPMKSKEMKSRNGCWLWLVWRQHLVVRSAALSAGMCANHSLSDPIREVRPPIAFIDVANGRNS